MSCRRLKLYTVPACQHALDLDSTNWTARFRGIHINSQVGHEGDPHGDPTVQPTRTTHKQDVSKHT